MKGIGLVAVVVVAACTEAPGARIVGTVEPTFEIVDEMQRLDASLVNVEIRGTFQVPGGGTAPRVLGLGQSEPARFPGNPPHGPGTCLDGKWFNAKGKATSGTPDKPHPHCWDPGSEGMTIVLEPISGQFEDPNSFGQTWLHFTHYDEKSHGVYAEWVPAPTGGEVCKVGGCLVMRGDGTALAYAIDAATNVRVGTLEFSFAGMTNIKNPITENLFECSLSGDKSQDGCLNLIIDAQYEPLAPEEGGAGSSQQVSGFLYWVNVSA